MTTVFITGGNRGIGLELAKAYHRAGATVLRGVRDPSAAKRDLGEVHRLDVADPGSVGGLARALAGRPIDILINNAGVIGPDRQSALDMDFDGFLDTLKINTLGPLRVSQALLSNLLSAASLPRIAIISSRMGSLSNAASDHMAYRASKAAVNKLGQGLATDLKPKGVAVAVIHPGWVRTDMGGSGADIDVAESAAGIKAVIEGLELETSGRFWNYDGRSLAW